MPKKYLDSAGLNKFAAMVLSKFAAKNHSHSSATTNSAGFMSANDKVKLDGVSAGANKTIVDSTLSSTSVNAIQNKAVKTALDGKASSSHTHPTAQITGLDAALASKAPSSHNHSADNITSGVLPVGRGGTGANSAAGAVSSFFPNTGNLGYVATIGNDWSGGYRANADLANDLYPTIKAKTDALYQPKGSYAAASHSHTIANITNLQSTLDSKQPKQNPVTTSGTGAAYTATVPGVTSLATGATFTMIPHVVSADTSPTLNVNNLGAKLIRQRLSNSTLSTAPGAVENWLAAGKPVEVMYDGQFWVVDFVRPNMASAYGVLPAVNGGVPSCTDSDHGKILTVYHGMPLWSTQSFDLISTGTDLQLKSRGDYIAEIDGHKLVNGAGVQFGSERCHNMFLHGWGEVAFRTTGPLKEDDLIVEISIPGFSGNMPQTDIYCAITKPRFAQSDFGRTSVKGPLYVSWEGPNKFGLYYPYIRLVAGIFGIDSGVSGIYRFEYFAGRY